MTILIQPPQVFASSIFALKVYFYSIRGWRIGNGSPWDEAFHRFCSNRYAIRCWNRIRHRKILFLCYSFWFCRSSSLPQYLPSNRDDGDTTPIHLCAFLQHRYPFRYHPSCSNIALPMCDLHIRRFLRHPYHVWTERGLCYSNHAPSNGYHLLCCLRLVCPAHRLHTNHNGRWRWYLCCSISPIRCYHS